MADEIRATIAAEEDVAEAQPRGLDVRLGALVVEATQLVVTGLLDRGQVNWLAGLLRGLRAFARGHRLANQLGFVAN